VSGGIWQRWDARGGTWYATGLPGSSVCAQSSPCTWNQVLASFPNAGISASGGVLLRAGGPSPAFDGDVDALTIGVAGTPTTFDFEQACLEDLNSDGQTSFADLLAFAGAYGYTPASLNWNRAADFNTDGKIAFADLLLFAAHYGQNPCT